MADSSATLPLELVPDSPRPSSELALDFSNLRLDSLGTSHSGGSRDRPQSISSRERSSWEYDSDRSSQYYRTDHSDHGSQNVSGPEEAAQEEADILPPRRSHSSREQSPGPPVDFVAEATANILLYALQNNISNATSDYAYVLSLSPFFSVHLPGYEYTYPDNLPKTIFVDRIGWMGGDEVVRYLMMGYRVWNEEGLRLHFPGTPLGYDSLKAPFRYAKKTVCTQDLSLYPDLHVQIRADSLGIYKSGSGDQKSNERPMPWDITMPKANYASESKNRPEDVQRAWIELRFENARSCYWRDECLSYEPYGGKKLDSPPPIPLTDEQKATLSFGSYPQIGIDSSYLSIKYPPTRVTLTGDGGDQAKTVHGLCELCASLDFKDVFEWGLEDLEADFGTLEELKQRDHCDFCRILSVLCVEGLDCLRRKEESVRNDPVGSDSDDYDDGWRFDEPIQVALLRNPILCLSTKPHLVLKQSYHMEYMGPIVSLLTIRGDIRGNYTIENPRYVDFQIISNMIDDCTTNHDDCRVKDANEDRAHAKIILIDVENMCLVEQSPGDAQYITLSYVWGRKPMLKTIKANFQQLQTSGALLEAGVSQLTCDSIVVAKGLGQQYLWIDALCIIQDDAEHKMIQIQRMAEIYGHSYLTITALTGEDCDSPLPGVSKARPGTMAVVDGVPFTFHLPGLKQTACDLVYEQRGWTFQERLISRRCLYFSRTQVFFECNHGSTSDHEQMFPACDRGKYAHPFNPLKKMMKEIDEEELKEPQEVAVVSIPQLEGFSDMVSKYTIRNLSFQSDIENAFLGVQKVISDKRAWNFACGLPAGVLDWALLWLPRGQLERRSWSLKAGDSTCSPPSWSWLGWKGQVSYACYTYFSKPLLQKLRPRIESFTIKSGDESIKVRRQRSAIWHPETQAAIKEGLTNNVPLYLSSGENPILEFEAEAITALRKRTSRGFVLEGVEWLNTGTDYGMLRHGLRHNYNEAVLQLARERDRDRLELIAMASCDLQMTFRGGQFAEDKLFERKDVIVVMLICWDEVRDTAERMAIGYVDYVSEWERLRWEKKTIRLR